MKYISIDIFLKLPVKRYLAINRYRGKIVQHIIKRTSSFIISRYDTSLQQITDTTIYMLKIKCQYSGFIIFLVTFLAIFRKLRKSIYLDYCKHFLQDIQEITVFYPVISTFAVQICYTNTFLLYSYQTNKLFSLRINFSAYE